MKRVMVLAYANRNAARRRTIRFPMELSSLVDEIISGTFNFDIGHYFPKLKLQEEEEIKISHAEEVVEEWRHWIISYKSVTLHIVNGSSAMII